MYTQSSNWLGEKRGEAMRSMIKKKSERQMAKRSFRARRKTLAKRIARQTGRSVHWEGGRLVFTDTRKLASGHPVPKAA